MSANNGEFALPSEVADELRSDAVALRQEALDESRDREARVEAMGLFLENIAGLAAGGVPVPAELLQGLPADLLQASVEALSGDDLIAAADDVNEMVGRAIDEAWDEETLLGLASKIEWPLLQRQRFTVRLEGARQVLGTMKLSEEQVEAVDYFDGLVRPLAWGLTFINQHREGHGLLVAPADRRARWWWTEATDISWEAVRSAAEVAEIAERYPSFAQHLDRLRASARARLGLVAKKETSTPKLTGNELLENLLERAEGTVIVGPWAKADDAKFEHRLRLVAAMKLAPGEEKPLHEVPGQARVLLGRDQQGYYLRVWFKEPARLESGSPQLLDESGEPLDAEQEGGSWAFKIGRALQGERKFRLQYRHAGKDEDHPFTIE